jgi:UDP-N-acetylmuramoyl-tripeptide--D-alanyl-D-alanine ligase
MKTILRQILKYYLKIITKLVLTIHRPLVIGITGSINEFFTKNEIKRQLIESKLEVRSNPKNFNTEIGMPLAILNLASGYDSYSSWLIIMWRALKTLFGYNFPKILLIGYGVAKPGDMKYLLSLIKPKIGVITEITQRYVDSFDSMDELAGEYAYFIKSIDNNGILLLNYDNPRIKMLADITDNKKIYFGLNQLSGEKVAREDYWQGIQIKKTVNGQTVEVINQDNRNNYQINRFGEHHIYALLAGLIVKKLVLNLK